eukprot:555327-Rhodomonas_salina.4
MRYSTGYGTKPDTTEPLSPAYDARLPPYSFSSPYSPPASTVRAVSTAHRVAPYARTVPRIAEQRTL